MRQLAMSLNGLTVNGISVNGFTINGILVNGTPLSGGLSLMDLAPNGFSSEQLGKQWIDPAPLGPKGVGDLSQVANIRDIDGKECNSPHDFCVLDNRHINPALQETLCEGSSNGEKAREYLDALVGLAWPENVALWLCCSDKHTAPIQQKEEDTPTCLDPDFIFQVSNTQDEAINLAPHFLTTGFERGQQEALTAAFIAKINTHGKPQMMDLAGRFDLGAAGTKVVTRHDPGVFHHYLGKAWGNMFLDCTDTDAADPQCQSSNERDGLLGRDPVYHSLAMFTCSGGSDYNVVDSGKACFSENMETNIDNGCGMVAATGACDVVCSGGLCRNAVSVFMADSNINAEASTNHDETNTGALVGIFLAVATVLALAAFVLLRWSKQETQPEDSNSTNVKSSHTVADDELEEP